MNCPTGGYPTLNELRDFTADALSEVCSGVCVVGVAQHQRAYFDDKVFNPTALSYCTTSVSSLYGKRNIDEVRGEVEISSFVPLVFSILGRMSDRTHVVQMCLAYLLSLKRGIP